VVEKVESKKSLNVYTLRLLVQLRTREGPIRTIAQIPVQIKVPGYQTLPIYEAFAPKIQELKTLGLTSF
jgi:hypothetical protein